MAKRGSSGETVPCYICERPYPKGKYNDLPWHLTCGYDEAGQKKIAVWKREQKKSAQSEIPTFDLPES